MSSLSYSFYCVSCIDFSRTHLQHISRNDPSIIDRAKSFLNEDIILRKSLLTDLYDTENNSIGIKRKISQYGGNESAFFVAKNSKDVGNKFEVRWSNRN